MRGSVPVVNGRPRRNLTEEIDRLESILDGLADALNGAVADAVKDAVGAAARDALAATAPHSQAAAAAANWPTLNVAPRLTRAAAAAQTLTAQVAGYAAGVVSREPKVGLAAAGAGLTVAAVCWAAPSLLTAVLAGGAVALLVGVAAGTRP